MSATPRMAPVMHKIPMKAQSVSLKVVMGLVLVSLTLVIVVSKMGHKLSNVLNPFALLVPVLPAREQICNRAQEPRLVMSAWAERVVNPLEPVRLTPVIAVTR